jgi:hypothetical protein
VDYGTAVRRAEVSGDCIDKAFFGAAQSLERLVVLRRAGEPDRLARSGNATTCSLGEKVLGPRLSSAASVLTS